jgi:hypothetical protein
MLICRLFCLAALLSAASAYAETLSVDDPRPEAAAVWELENKYGYVITYEDPPFVFAADLKDVTRDRHPELSAEEAAKEPRRVMIARGGKIRVTYRVGKDGRPKDPVRLIQSILDSLRPGTFKLVRDGEIFHVLPVRHRDRDGRMVEEESPLDTRISLPQLRRSESELRAAICDAVSRQNHIQLGMASAGGLGGVISRIGAESVVARDLLRATIVEHHESWRMLWIPWPAGWALNIHRVPNRDPPSRAIRRLPPWMVPPIHHRDPDSGVVGEGDGGAP